MQQIRFGNDRKKSKGNDRLRFAVPNLAVYAGNKVIFDALLIGVPSPAELPSGAKARLI